MAERQRLDITTEATRRQDRRRRLRQARRTAAAGPGRSAAAPSSARSTPTYRRVRGGFDGLARGVAGSLRPASSWDPTRDQLELLAALLESGVSVAQAFATLERAATSRATRMGASTVSRRIREGSRVAAALEEAGASRHTVALATAGERTGCLADAFRSAGAIGGRFEELRSTLRRALAYPSVVLGVGVGMLVLIAVAVMPQLERTFVELGGELPLPTRIVVAASAALRTWWTPLLVLAVLVLRRVVPLVTERIGLRGGVLRLPVVRRFHADLSSAIVARVVATMLAGGVPFVDALRHASHSVGPGSHRELIERAAANVAQGRSAFDDDGLGGLVGAADREILGVAERTGLLADQWMRVAERRAHALDERVARIGAVTEPLLVVLVGAVVGGAVLALYLPTFRILDLV